MSTYVDGFVLPLPKDKIEDYRKLAEVASQVWREYGALDYRECILEEDKVETGISFPKLANVKEGETVVFAYITYKSKADRDIILPKVMADSRLANCCNPETMPFDGSRMTYGGFETLVGN
jgi:uncharacterized protein YbaA (DUF1428 family)